MGPPLLYTTCNQTVASTIHFVRVSGCMSFLISGCACRICVLRAPCGSSCACTGHEQPIRTSYLRHHRSPRRARRNSGTARRYKPCRSARTPEGVPCSPMHHPLLRAVCGQLHLHRARTPYRSVRVQATYAKTRVFFLLWTNCTSGTAT